MGRAFTTVRSVSWSTPMRDKVPDGYDELLRDAPDAMIDPAYVDAFVDEIPGVDVQGGRGRSYFRKLVMNSYTNAGENKPDAFYRFPAFVAADDEWRSLVELSDGYVIVRMNTNLYALWDAVHAWGVYRASVSEEGYKGDNGWFRHGVRLAARYQYYTLTGKINWLLGSPADAPAAKRVAPPLLHVSKIPRYLQTPSVSHRRQCEAENREQTQIVNKLLLALQRLPDAGGFHERPKWFQGRHFMEPDLLFTAGRKVVIVEAKYNNGSTPISHALGQLLIAKVHAPEFFPEWRAAREEDRVLLMAVRPTENPLFAPDVARCYGVLTWHPDQDLEAVLRGA